MINKDNTNNKIQFEKIGDIYYPVFNDMQPSLGFYAKKRKDFQNLCHQKSPPLFDKHIH